MADGRTEKMVMFGGLVSADLRVRFLVHNLSIMIIGKIDE